MSDDTRLLDLEQCLKLKTHNEIQTQVDIRRNLIRQMVGNLYPSILMDEIDKLHTLAAILTREYA